MMRTCLVIPVYNHGDVIGSTVAALQSLQLPIILVDDGSEPACAAVLDRLVARADLQLERLPANRGKGGALKHGLHAAWAAGFTHVLQVDADGQHDPDDIPPFLVAAREQPEAIISGYAVYDACVPRARHYGRYLTHLWVWVNTLSRTIPDSMCGVRVYPLAGVLPLLAQHPMGDRMEFDTEILVRAYWAGLSIQSLPVRVRYPRDGVSHFRLWRDNLRISWMHARLFLGMLGRIPQLLARHRQ